jgi:hypothetical protein
MLLCLLPPHNHPGDRYNCHAYLQRETEEHFPVYPRQLENVDAWDAGQLGTNPELYLKGTDAKKKARVHLQQASQA